jgi:type IV pilus assembly protein PilV
MSKDPRPTRAESQPNNEDGFTIIEMLVACMILLVGVLSVATMIGSSVTSNVFAKNDSVAAGLAERELERLKSLSFNSASLADGTTTLTPVTLANSDAGNAPITYTLSVTIVTEGASAPAPGVKRITVTATRQNFRLFNNTPAVQMTFIKAP